MTPRRRQRARIELAPPHSAARAPAGGARAERVRGARAYCTVSVACIPLASCSGREQKSVKLPLRRFTVVSRTPMRDGLGKRGFQFAFAREHVQVVFVLAAVDELQRDLARGDRRARERVVVLDRDDLDMRDRRRWTSSPPLAPPLPSPPLPGPLPPTAGTPGSVGASPSAVDEPGAPPTACGAGPAVGSRGARPVAPPVYTAPCRRPACARGWHCFRACARNCAPSAAQSGAPLRLPHRWARQLRSSRRTASPLRSRMRRRPRARAGGASGASDEQVGDRAVGARTRQAGSGARDHEPGFGLRATVRARPRRARGSRRC